MKDLVFPGKKHEIFREYDVTYGKDNWEIGWFWNGGLLNYEEACKLYECSYFQDSFNREKLWTELFKTARDVYDHDPSDVESGLDYTIQNSNSTHIQDITIRNIGESD